MPEPTELVSVPSAWVCTNAACAEQGRTKQGDAPADATVICGACQQSCEYRTP